jgi:hypothetical protein
MKKSNKAKFETRTVEIKKTVLLDEFGNEDTLSFKGSLFNQPITWVGFFIAYIFAPALTALTNIHGIFPGLLFIIGNFIAIYSNRQ